MLTGAAAALFSGAAPAHARVEDSAWRDLAARISGRVLRPGDAGFAELAPVANRAYPTLPEGILVPANESDVAAGVLWVQEHSLPIAARCGGHSYAGYSTTRGLLVHLADMKRGTVDVDRRIATVQAGMQNRDVFAALRDTGLKVPFGRCPEVGVSGYLLGGGIGLHSRRLGMGCDSLLGTRVVTSAGEVLVADESSDPELYWSCRGGAGGNVGLNTEFTVRLHAAPDVTVYDLKWTGRRAEELLLALQALLADAELGRDLEMQFGVRSGGRTALDARRNVSVYAQGQFYGSEARLRAILQPLLAVDEPTFSHFAELGWARALEYFILMGGTTPYLTTSVVAVREIGDADAYRIVEQVRDWPGSGASGTGVSVSMFALGGAEDDLAPDATAYVHRGAKFIMSATTYWSKDDSPLTTLLGRVWIDGFRGEMAARLGEGAFVNFPGPTMSRWWEAYYGSNYDRLVRAKEKYDPVNLFRYPQSIRAMPR